MTDLAIALRRVRLATVSDDKAVRVWIIESVIPAVMAGAGIGGRRGTAGIR